MSKLPEQSEHCLNCGEKLQGPYCAACGQKALEKKHESFWKTMGHFLGDFVHFDSLIFRTLAPLMFKPGFLANEYLAGRRVKYLNPIRMYVFLSFLFFFLTFSVKKEEPVQEVNVIGLEEVDTADSILRDQTDSIPGSRNYKLSFDTSLYHSLAEYDSVQLAVTPEKRDGFLKRSFIRKAFQTKAKVEKDGAVGFVNEMMDGFKHNFPKLAFLLLPFFALLLKLFFRNKSMYYMEHLVFSVYLYNFFFLAGSILILFSFVFPKAGDVFDTIFYWGLALYFYVGLKKVYENGWIKTFFKLFGVAIFFSIIAGLALFLNMCITFLMI